MAEQLMNTLSLRVVDLSYRCNIHCSWGEGRRSVQLCIMTLHVLDNRYIVCGNNFDKVFFILYLLLPIDFVVVRYVGYIVVYHVDFVDSLEKNYKKKLKKY